MSAKLPRETMEIRQENLLKLVIDSYIRTAEPVGSKFLVSEYELDMSDATVRNELRELEEAGFLTHPHTSAGRIPTEAGYKLYVEKLMAPVVTPKKIRAAFEQIAREAVGDEGVKLASKALAEEMQNAVIVAFGPDRVYYTGLSGLFAQPEFRSADYTINASAMFDQAEDLVGQLFERVVTPGPAIFVGSDNPLGSHFSLVTARLPNNTIINIMGPLRLDYAKGQSLMNLILELSN